MISFYNCPDKVEKLNRYATTDDFTLFRLVAVRAEGKELTVEESVELMKNMSENEKRQLLESILLFIEGNTTEE